MLTITSAGMLYKGSRKDDNHDMTQRIFDSGAACTKYLLEVYTASFLVVGFLRSFADEFGL